MKIKEARQKMNLSQKELAAILNIPANTLSNWENGNRQPDHAILVRLADYLHVSTDYLLGREEDPIPDEFVVMARKVGNLSPETRKRIYRMLDKNIDDVLSTLNTEESDKGE